MSFISIDHGYIKTDAEIIRLEYTAVIKYKKYYFIRENKILSAKSSHLLNRLSPETKERNIYMNLKLVTTETFGTVSCDFYRNMNDEMMLTRNQIGQALEYRNPQKAIDNIHSKHKDRLNDLSVTLKLRGTDGKEYLTTLYTQRGVMEICRWSRQQKANQFMDWVWDIIEAYRNNSMQQMNLQPLISAITTLTNSVSKMQEDIIDLKENMKNRYLSQRYPSVFYKKMKPKYEMLQDYFGCTRSQLYSSIYKELEDTYDVDINQVHEEYCYENHLLKTECYPMDAIEHNSQLKDALVLLVNDSLIKYGLQTEEEIKNTKRETLFSRE